MSLGCTRASEYFDCLTEFMKIFFNFILESAGKHETPCLSHNYRDIYSSLYLLKTHNFIFPLIYLQFYFAPLLVMELGYLLKIQRAFDCIFALQSCLKKFLIERKNNFIFSWSVISWALRIISLIVLWLAWYLRIC